jgi:molecular chaperone GrpE
MTTSREPTAEPPPEDDTVAEPPAQPQDSAEVRELRERWQRSLADLDNMRKRHVKDLDRERATERDRVAAVWLPVVDNLELALAHATSDPASVVDGVRAVRDQAVNLLDRLGYGRDDETGVPFDPLRHEVVSVVDDPGAEPGTVVEALRPGYGGNGHQLRPMSAVVSKQRE